MYSVSEIMIIRHAEKPTQDGLIGIAADGQPDPESLSQIGWDRARKLVDFFARPTAANIERPDAIFAAAPEVGSKRPVETVIPLVEALHMGHFNTSIRKDNVHHLASAVMATNGVILVCWEHTLIPAAIQALPNPPPTTPTKWPGSRFDVVWILNAKPDGGWDLHQTPQMLLPSDQASVIPPHPNIPVHSLAVRVFPSTFTSPSTR
jgi:hypothetical protein